VGPNPFQQALQLSTAAEVDVLAGVHPAGHRVFDRATKAAQVGRPLQEGHRVSAVRKVEGTADPSQAASDHHHLHFASLT
jgi:hypothetical protein